MLCSHSVLTALQSLHPTHHENHLLTVVFAVAGELCRLGLYMHAVVYLLCERACLLDDEE